MKKPLKLWLDIGADPISAPAPAPAPPAPAPQLPNRKNRNAAHDGPLFPRRYAPSESRSLSTTRLIGAWRIPAGE